MKKILITGANSYIGTSVEKYLKEKNKDEYSVDVLDMTNDNWKNYSFEGYDCIYHVAGIAHSDYGEISKEKAALYYKVNSALTAQVAKKAKENKIKQFIFMSSSIVYGGNAPIGVKKIITAETLPSPLNAYGDSKLQAEIAIVRVIKNENINYDDILNDNKKSNVSLSTNDFDNMYKSNKDFKVVVLRPPVIFGPNSKGNYRTLEKIAKKVSLFPYVDNEKSMFHINHLCEFIKERIDKCDAGLFFPQDEKYYNTSELLKDIGKNYGKNIILAHGFTWLLKILSKFSPLVDKAFGNFVYDVEI